MRWCVLLLLLLGSCAAKAPPDPYPLVYVTDRAKYRLLNPAYLENLLDMPQQITGTYGNQEFVFQTWVMADKTRVLMSLFNSFGAGLGELSFAAEGLSLSSGIFPPSLKPEYIIADFQFCFYQPHALASALNQCGLTLTVTQGDPPILETRRIWEGTKLLIAIEKTPRIIRYTNHLRGYAYTLEGAF